MGRRAPEGCALYQIGSKLLFKSSCTKAAPLSGWIENYLLSKHELSKAGGQQVVALLRNFYQSDALDQGGGKLLVGPESSVGQNPLSSGVVALGTCVRTEFRPISAQVMPNPGQT